MRGSRQALLSEGVADQIAPSWRVHVAARRSDRWMKTAQLDAPLTEQVDCVTCRVLVNRTHARVQRGVRSMKTQLDALLAEGVADHVSPLIRLKGFDRRTQLDMLLPEGHADHVSPLVGLEVCVALLANRAHPPACRAECAR